MPVSAHDVARELRRRLPGVGVLKVHKLLYYAQGWHLTRFGRPLFAERIDAWVNGPVVVDLWRDEKRERGRPRPLELGGDDQATVDYVVGRYGRFTGKELIRLTHNEGPWRDVSESDDPSVASEPEISHESLRLWFEADDDQQAHVAEVARLRGRPPYTFAALTVTPGVETAVARAVEGRRGGRDPQG
jgi:uncharacterized phage-associated protein